MTGQPASTPIWLYPTYTLTNYTTQHVSLCHRFVSIVIISSRTPTSKYVSWYEYIPCGCRIVGYTNLNNRCKNFFRSPDGGELPQHCISTLLETRTLSRQTEFQIQLGCNLPRNHRAFSFCKTLTSNPARRTPQVYDNTHGVLFVGHPHHDGLAPDTISTDAMYVWDLPSLI